MRQQYVYKLTKANWQQQPYDDVIIVSDIGNFLKYLKILKQVMNSTDLLKTLLKILADKRALTLKVLKNKVEAWSIISFAQCSHYPIGKNDAVIGPVNTEESSQGKGLATKIMYASLVFSFVRKHCDAVFIDTAEDNYAMQRVIEKCHFGARIQQYDRND